MTKFSSNINYLRQYVNGELTSAEMYEIERAMHEDEMLMDIIEGLEIEKASKSSQPTLEIITNIRKRSQNTKGTKIISIKNFSIAASIIAIFSVGILYFMLPKNKVDGLASTENTSISPAPKAIPDKAVNPDSSLMAYIPQDEIKAASAIQNKTVKPRTSKTTTEPQKKLMVYAAKPKMQVVIEGPRFLHQEKEEVIGVPVKTDVTLPGSELLTAKVNTSSASTTNPSLAKTQADLQRLDMDPQTKANLSAILSRQALENQIELEEKQTENTISEVLISGNALAQNKNTDARIISSTESLGTILAKPIQNGNPTTGWSLFNSYIKDQLKKRGFLVYNANISFDLNEVKKPVNIEIKTSSNSKLNAALIEILKTGPTWENKDPNHPIFIRINSEETP